MKATHEPLPARHLVHALRNMGCLDYHLLDMPPESPQIHRFARAVVLSEDIEVKLTPPAGPLGDDEPGTGDAPGAPGRPAHLQIQSGPRTRVPPIQGLKHSGQRARILHAFANHELQAVELFAWALLAFPRAPAEFRRGLLATLVDEQRHTRLYIDRLAEHGAAFGDHPVSGYFWGKLEQLSTPRGFVCGMCLTFENANLDHTLDFAAEAERLGDVSTAAILREVHDDEVRHVRFGLRWLEAFKHPDESLADAYQATVRWPLRPLLARGPNLHVDARRAAGFDDAFVELLRAAESDSRRR